MIFWIFVILTVLGIIVSFIGDREDWNGIACVGAITAVISVIVAIIMLLIIISAHASADGIRASSEKRYETLIYKSQTENIRDDFGIINKEYIDEIQEWNEDLAAGKEYSHNFWIGIFYPKRQYDGFEFIDLESIKMKE